LVEEDQVLLRAHCGTTVGSASRGYKEKLAMWQHDLPDIGPRFTDAAHFVDQPMIWREFFCPACATRLATEVARPDDPVLDDIRLNP
jgi:N-methylhydantoinase B